MFYMACAASVQLTLFKIEQEENRVTFIKGLVISLQYNKVFCSQKMFILSRLWNNLFMKTEFIAALRPDLKEHIDKFAAKSRCYHLEALLFKIIFRI